MIRVFALLAVLLPVPLAAQEQVFPAATLTMTGTAHVDVDPDVTILRAIIAASDPSAVKALAEVEARIASLSDALEAFGTTKTSRIAIGQNREKGKRLLGSDEATYFARGTLALKLSDPSRGAPALDVLGKGGISGVVAFENNVADRAPLLEQAREGAVADALERAKTYAAAANLTLGPILTIEETRSNGNTAGHQQAPYKRSVSGGYGKGWTAGPTDISVSATVTITWRVE